MCEVSKYEVPFRTKRLEGPIIYENVSALRNGVAASVHLYGLHDIMDGLANLDFSWSPPSGIKIHLEY